MKTTNPVLARLGQAAERERAAGYAPAGPHGQPGFGQPAGYGQQQPYPTGEAYPAAPPTVQPMTIDDVVMKTVTLLAIVGVTGAAAWILVPDALLGPLWIGAALIGLVLGLVISFSRMANPALVVAYAVIATFGFFFLMAFLYRARDTRPTPKFVRGMIAVMAGLFAVMLINFVLSLFDVTTGLRSNGALGIGFSIICIVVASLSFILSFNEVEEGVRMGLPQRYSWTAAFGILVSLIWLYLEVLRLLSFLQGDD